MKFLGFRGIAFTLFLLFIGTVGLQNLEPVTVDVLLWNLIEIPKLYLILGCFGIGVVGGMILLSFLKAGSKKDS